MSFEHQAKPGDTIIALRDFRGLSADIPELEPVAVRGDVGTVTNWRLEGEFEAQFDRTGLYTTGLYDREHGIDWAFDERKPRAADAGKSGDVLGKDGWAPLPRSIASGPIAHISVDPPSADQTEGWHIRKNGEWTPLEADEKDKLIARLRADNEALAKRAAMYESAYGENREALAIADKTVGRLLRGIERAERGRR